MYDKTTTWAKKRDGNGIPLYNIYYKTINGKRECFSECLQRYGIKFWARQRTREIDYYIKVRLSKMSTPVETCSDRYVRYPRSPDSVSEE